MANNHVLSTIARFLSADSSGNLTGTASSASSNVSKRLATTDSLASKIQPITASVAVNALTVTLNPTVLDFRSATLTSGTVNTRIISSAISLVVPSTATLGTISTVQSRLVVLAIDNAGTVELAITNISGGINLDETGVITTTILNASSTSSSVVYSTVARTGVSYRVVGYVESTQATAGTWVTAPSTIQGQGGQALTSMSSLGYGQTYQTVTGSRILGTTYYNTTGRPIWVHCVTSNGSGGTSYVTFTVDGITVNTASTPAGGFASANFIVRQGQAYSSNNPGGFSLVQWVELR